MAILATTAMAGRRFAAGNRRGRQLRRCPYRTGWCTPAWGHTPTNGSPSSTALAAPSRSSSKGASRADASSALPLTISSLHAATLPAAFSTSTLATARATSKHLQHTPRTQPPRHRYPALLTSHPSAPLTPCHPRATSQRATHTAVPIESSLPRPIVRPWR